MKYKPKSEEQIAKERLIPDGIYDFEILEANDGCSKSGKDMITLKMRVYLPSGNSISLTDWLVATEEMSWKIRKFAESIGMLAEYETGELIADDMPGRSGKVQITSKDDPEYGPQNRVKGYGEPKSRKGTHELAVGGKRPLRNPGPPTRPDNDLQEDDDIPF